jgi:hypothetical protein
MERGSRGVCSGECFRTHMTERLRSVGLNIAHKLGQMGRTARWNKKNVPTFLNKMLGLGACFNVQCGLHY